MPPKYLSVPAFERCLATQTMDGGDEAWCLPARRATGKGHRGDGACPLASWRALQRLQGSDGLVRCRAP